MSERGPRGDHGQHGDTGDIGPAGRTGERGPEGHAGERGPIGDVGAVGPEGKSSRLATRSTLSFIIITVVFTAILAGLGLVIVDNRQLASEGREAHDALCVLHEDLERRIDAARQFLKDNPEGIPGIPASTLRNSIANQEATLGALGRLDCVPPPKEE